MLLANKVAVITGGSSGEHFCSHMRLFTEVANANCALVQGADERYTISMHLIMIGNSPGIGAATVRKFLKEGAKVAIADLQEEAGREVLADFPHESAIFVHCDVRSVIEI
jgi:NAD(P)-dependent dehydrogenase (short-subunit alcohol dehydrogenase family)